MTDLVGAELGYKRIDFRVEFLCFAAVVSELLGAAAGAARSALVVYCIGPQS